MFAFSVFQKAHRVRTSSPPRPTSPIRPTANAPRRRSRRRFASTPSPPLPSPSSCRRRSPPTLRRPPRLAPTTTPPPPTPTGRRQYDDSRQRPEPMRRLRFFVELSDDPGMVRRPFAFVVFKFGTACALSSCRAPRAWKTCLAPCERSVLLASLRFQHGGRLTRLHCCVATPSRIPRQQSGAVASAPSQLRFAGGLASRNSRSARRGLACPRWCWLRGGNTCMHYYVSTTKAKRHGAASVVVFFNLHNIKIIKKRSGTNRARQSRHSDVRSPRRNRTLFKLPPLCGRDHGRGRDVAGGVLAHASRRRNDGLDGVVVRFSKFFKPSSARRKTCRCFSRRALCLLPADWAFRGRPRARGRASHSRSRGLATELHHRCPHHRPRRDPVPRAVSGPFWIRRPPRLWIRRRTVGAS